MDLFELLMKARGGFLVLLSWCSWPGRTGCGDVAALGLGHFSFPAATSDSELLYQVEPAPRCPKRS